MEVFWCVVRILCLVGGQCLCVSVGDSVCVNG